MYGLWQLCRSLFGKEAAFVVMAVMIVVMCFVAANSQGRGGGGSGSSGGAGHGGGRDVGGKASRLPWEIHSHETTA